MKAKSFFLKVTAMLLLIAGLSMVAHLYGENRLEITRSNEPDWKVLVDGHQVIIVLTLRQSDFVNLEIFDARNEPVRNLYQGVFSRGEHFVVWDGFDDSNHIMGGGVYIVKLKSGQTFSSRKMIILK